VQVKVEQIASTCGGDKFIDHCRKEVSSDERRPLLLSCHRTDDPEHDLANHHLARYTTTRLKSLANRNIPVTRLIDESAPSQWVSIYFGDVLHTLYSIAIRKINRSVTISSTTSEAQASIIDYGPILTE
jgi:hypothetical protein